MTIAIMQPTWLPWVGYFDLIDQSDIFVILDDVQFSNHTWQQRNQIKTDKGLKWLTVPVYSKDRFGQKIIDVEIDVGKFPEKMLYQIKEHYSKSIYFSDYFYDFEELLLGYKGKFLCDLNVTVLKWIMSKLDINTKIIHSSAIDIGGKRGERTVAILNNFNEKNYLSPMGSYNYLKEDIKYFKQSNINSTFQNYIHPEYNQLYQPFLASASIIDLMFNNGVESMNIIRSGRSKSIDFDKMCI